MNVDDQVGDTHLGQTQSHALSLGSDVEGFVGHFLSSLGVAQDDADQLLILSISVRCFSFFRAILCLARAQLSQPTAACLRVLIEQRWVFEAFARETTRTEAKRRLVQHEEHNRNVAMDNLRALGHVERDHRITDVRLAEVKAGIDPDKAKHSLKGWADLAGRTSEYLTAYALLCNQTHPSLKAVDNHLLCDADGRALSVTTKASVQSLPLYTVHACEVMIDVIAACPEPWLTADVVSQATALRHRLSGLWDRVPDPLLNQR